MAKKDINFALVETTRPPLYTAMKYWGKKPHNIWREYIERYTPEDGVYLDPFAGSAISVFEAVKVNRKAIGFDLNPLTTFIIEVLSSKLNHKVFQKAVLEILEDVSNDKTYQNFFTSKCPECGEKAVAQNFKWEEGKIYEVGIECKNCALKNATNTGDSTRRQEHWNGTHVRYLRAPNEQDHTLSKTMESIDIAYWHPDTDFPKSPSFSGNFIDCIGGRKFRDLWTRRNLYVLSRIFDSISKVDDSELRQQLLFGFTQTIHLCTKMSVPRRSGANRPFSTSWGRSAYICSSRQMEMNPLLVFEGSCFGKQSVTSALEANEEYLGKLPQLVYVDDSNKANRTKAFDIKYGIVDINTIGDYVDRESVDFIMTDPPYGGLVQYLDLSLIWLVWLQRLDDRLAPNMDAEITIKRGVQNEDSYERKFLNALRQLHRVLKPDGKIVFTFHNKTIKIWNMFLKSLSLAGFKVEKVIHQQNRRTGEANVANPYGTSASDFYIRCVKAVRGDLNTDMGEFEHFVVTKAIELISLRNEPTPFQILFNGLLVEISSAGFDLADFDSNIEKVLSKNLGEIFKVTENNDNKAGKYWWFSEPDEFIKYPDKKLADRVEETVIAFLRRRNSVTFDEVLGEVFVKYPNGLIPDQKSVRETLARYAYKSSGRWVYKGDLIETTFTAHTQVLFNLFQIGKKLGYGVFIGKREQPEPFGNGTLGDHADLKNLEGFGEYDIERLKRIEMIDMLWLDKDRIEWAFEVENSTNFTSGIQRCSNLAQAVKKVMVLPDSRKDEFERINDPMFREAFVKYNWMYMFYSDVHRFSGQREPVIDSLNRCLQRF